MFNRNVLKSIAYVVMISYISTFHVSSILAAEWKAPVTPQLLAQASTNPAVSKQATAEEEKALREIYSDKIRRLEAEMNNARGTRNTLLTVSITSLVIGAGLVTGSNTARDAVKKMPTDTAEQQEDVDDALEAIDAVKGVSNGFFGIGAVGLLGYLLYTSIISSKQRRIDRLRSELDARFAPKGLTPQYLQRNESVAAVIEEINDAKRSAGSARTLQSFFSRIGIASLLSGGFLYALAKVGDDVIEEIEIDEDSPKEVADRDDAREQLDKVELNGIILLAVGGTSAITSFIFGRRAKGKENLVDDLEDSLLRVAEGIDIHPRADGFMVMYRYEF